MRIRKLLGFHSVAEHPETDRLSLSKSVVESRKPRPALSGAPNLPDNASSHRDTQCHPRNIPFDDGRLPAKPLFRVLTPQSL
jgi:hypothetical protein